MKQHRHGYKSWIIVYLLNTAFDVWILSRVWAWPLVLYIIIDTIILIPLLFYIKTANDRYFYLFLVSTFVESSITMTYDFVNGRLSPLLIILYILILILAIHSIGEYYTYLKNQKKNQLT